MWILFLCRVMRKCTLPATTLGLMWTVSPVCLKVPLAPHISGVSPTVVCKLFNIVGADKAYFGQKDAQQCTVIQKMVKDLNMNLDIVICPTVREPDGLAMSSRNTYLTPEQRMVAPVLYKSLCHARDMFSKGERDAVKIRAAMAAMINKYPEPRIDYISITDTETLQACETIDKRALVSMAVRIGKPRLIDNIFIG